MKVLFENHHKTYTHTCGHRQSVNHTRQQEISKIMVLFLAMDSARCQTKRSVQTRIARTVRTVARRRVRRTRL